MVNKDVYIVPNLIAVLLCVNLISNTKLEAFLGDTKVLKI